MFNASHHQSILSMLAAAFLATGHAITPAAAEQGDRAETSARAASSAEHAHWDFQPDRGVVNQQFEQVWAMFPVDGGTVAQPVRSSMHSETQNAVR